MKSNDVIDALLALGQETRLAAYRLLVAHEPDGLPSGVIAEKLNANPSTVSRHLAQLERARLLRSRRDQRQIVYAIDHEGTGELLWFLTEDCCTVRPIPPGKATTSTRPRRRTKNLATS